MMQKRFLRCNDCRKGFFKLHHLNAHITVSGHNERQHVVLADLIDLTAIIKKIDKIAKDLLPVVSRA